MLVADRAWFPRDKACSEYMSPEAVRILTRLGVTEELEKAGGVALEGLKVTAPRGARAHGRFAGACPGPSAPPDSPSPAGSWIISSCSPPEPAARW